MLTSRFSASASEILVGALKDYGRALIVGDSSTFGKGTVQNILPLARVMDQAKLAHAYDPGALKITTQQVLPAERRFDPAAGGRVRHRSSFDH